MACSQQKREGAGTQSVVVLLLLFFYVHVFVVNVIDIVFYVIVVLIVDLIAMCFFGDSGDFCFSLGIVGVCLMIVGGVQPTKTRRCRDAGRDSSVLFCF